MSLGMCEMARSGARRSLRWIVPALVAAATLVAQHAARAGQPEVGAARASIILSDAQMDALTASGITASLDLTATATGPNVSTSTEGSVRTAHTTILSIDIEPSTDPSSPGSVRARLVGELPADLLFAAGSAKASGASNAQCTANLNTPSTFAFLTQLSRRSITPTLATCSCAAFGISLSP
jgi:hypothetical protein